MDVPPSAPPAKPSNAADPPRIELSYGGAAGAFAGLVLRTTLLTLVTLGIYRFWARTRIRAFLWRNTNFAGERLEYTGRGKELFIGFLIVLGVFAVLAGARSLLDLVPTEENDYLSAGIDLVYAALIFFLLPLARYRARRYRLSRTRWRGVRAGQDGSSVRYGFAALGYGLLTLVSFGLAYPLARVKLYAWRMSHTRFGDRRFRFDGRVGPLIRRWLLAWTPLAAGLSLAGYLMFIAFPQMMAQSADDGGPPERFDMSRITVPDWTPVAILVLLLMGAYAYVAYRTGEFRYFADRTKYEDLSFNSSLSAGHVAWIYLPYWAAMLAMFVGLVMVAGGVAVLTEDTEQGNRLAPFLLIGLIVVVSPILRYVLVVQRLARLLCRTLGVEGKQDFEEILQSSLAAPSRGEGLAEMLDTGGI